MRIKLILILIIAVVLGNHPVHAQKAYKAIRTSLKNKKPDDALKSFQTLRKDSAHMSDPKLYQFAVAAYTQKYEALNQTIYLKQKYDTAQFFTTNYSLCENILICDSLEQLKIKSEEKQYKEFKYRKSNYELLRKCANNISSGGRYYFSKGKYKEAEPFFKMYLAIPKKPIWGNDTTTISRKTYFDNIYFNMCSLYEQKKYDEMMQYEETLLADSNVRKYALEYYTLAAEAKGDYTHYVELLRIGAFENPDQPFYFTELADYYNERNDYHSAYELAESLLQKDSMNIYYLECKSLCLIKMEKYEEAVDVAKKCLAIDSTMIEAYFYIGAAYSNLATKVNFPTNVKSKEYKNAKKQQSNYYSLAKPYVEHYRKMAPDRQDRWAPLLYNIYLNLNYGREFGEIETLLNNARK